MTDDLHRFSPEDADRIAAELAALGEDPLGPGEGPGLPDTADVVLLQRLVDVADRVRATPDLGVLSEIEQGRAWKRIAAHMNAGPSEPVARGLRGGLVPVLAAVAAAAAVMLMPKMVPAPRTRAVQLEGLQQAARVGLEALGDPAPGSRAREMAAALATDGGER